MRKSSSSSIEGAVIKCTAGGALTGQDDRFSAHTSDMDIESGGQSKTLQPDSVLQDTDPNIVDWDGDDDPSKAVNWSPRKKWINITLLATLTLLTCVFLLYFAHTFNLMIDTVRSVPQCLHLVYLW